jgi:single-strand selective monofunctional uracil DNA glycosylase
VSLVQISRRLCRDVDRLQFGPPVEYVYNPLKYARATHEAYLGRFGAATGRVVLLGMNPGPFGMAQTGVPFGDVASVRDWMCIDGKVDRPPREHPRRLVTGFACPRAEVSGSRLWGWARTRFDTPEAFFARFFVLNYCPLVFMEESGKNRTPDKLAATERDALFAACDRALRDAMRALAPAVVAGVGGFAEKRARLVLGDATPIGVILHPSPASPKANQGWAEAVDRDMARLGLPGLAARAS